MVLVFAESQKGEFKKAAFEVVTYGYKTAQALGTECVALTHGEVKNAEELGKYGASKIYNVAGATSESTDSQVDAAVIANAAEKLGAKVIIMSHNSTGKALLGRLAARFDAGSVAGAVAIPDTAAGFKVRKTVFSGKAFADFEIKTDMKLVSVIGNSIPVEESGSAGSVEALDVEIPANRVTLKEINMDESGQVPLPEASLVVSAGRGMKGPENWGIIEELADVIGASTACSRPVSDTDWRPHHEHVGQTGLAIRPNLYIAVGISGAIQHLAGVNNSKTIVVINKDPEAPFFKAADYGVVGDLFEVVPRLTEAFKKFKG